MERGREEVSWAQVLQLLVVNRLIDPGSEFRVHRQWFDQSGMDVLLDVDFAVAEKDRLYRCLDRILKHKQDLFIHLRQRWKSLFDVPFDVLLYDLTSTYVEGEAEQNPKAKRGYSRDGRPDVLRDKVIKPLLAANLQTRRGRKSKNHTAIDEHYDRVQTEMRELFRTLGLAA